MAGVGRVKPGVRGFSRVFNRVNTAGFVDYLLTSAVENFAISPWLIYEDPDPRLFGERLGFYV